MATTQKWVKQGYDLIITDIHATDFGQWRVLEVCRMRFSALADEELFFPSFLGRWEVCVAATLCCDAGHWVKWMAVGHVHHGQCSSPRRWHLVGTQQAKQLIASCCKSHLLPSFHLCWPMSGLRPLLIPSFSSYVLSCLSCHPFFLFLYNTISPQNILRKSILFLISCNRFQHTNFSPDIPLSPSSQLCWCPHYLEMKDGGPAVWQHVRGC